MNCALKILLVILMFGPASFVAIILILLALIANCFTLTYFMLCGWTCEIELLKCHDPCIEGALKKPWKMFCSFSQKIHDFIIYEGESGI